MVTQYIGNSNLETCPLFIHKNVQDRARYERFSGHTPVNTVSYISLLFHHIKDMITNGFKQFYPTLYLPHIIQSTMVLPTMEVTMIREKQKVQMIWDKVHCGTTLVLLKVKIKGTQPSKHIFSYLTHVGLLNKENIFLL